MRPFARRRLGILVTVGISVGFLAWPVSTRQAVDYVVTERTIPLGLKAGSFIHRDLAYRRLAAGITRGIPLGEERAVALIEWVRRNIRPSSPGVPIVDDHILSIIERGHGTSDQVADVFTTLATYAGLPAFWGVLRLKKGEPDWILSFVRIEGRWTAWEAWRGGAFRDASGALLDVEALSAHPDLARLTLGDASHLGIGYEAYLKHGLAEAFMVPATIRAEKQMLGRRILFEARKLLHRDAG